MHLNLGEIAAGALAMACLSASAHPAIAAAPSAAGKWVVDWGEARCTLVRHAGGADAVTMIVRTYIGSRWPELLFVHSGWKEDQAKFGDELNVLLSPAGNRIVGKAAAGRLGGDGYRILSVRELEPDFFDYLSEAEGLSLEIDGKVILRLSFSDSKAAVAALTRCNDDLMQSWGVDIELRDSLLRQPKGVTPLWTWFRAEDYPLAAARQNKSGPVVVRYTVGVDGKVTECVPVVSADDPALDSRTCQLLKQRGRFEPALDTNGKPIAVNQIQTVTWSLEW